MSYSINFISIDSRFSHSNLAIYYLRTILEKNNISSKILRFTIQQPLLNILEKINCSDSDFLAFSVYIWNVELIRKLLPEIKKTLPKVKIILGGPEVGYNSDKWKIDFPEIDHVFYGYSEKSILEFLSNPEKQSFLVKEQNYKFNNIPFPYKKDDFILLKNRIIYYESSRGCPYRCSYCLSSRVDQKLEFRDFEKVCSELKILIQNEPKIIKFVDRTFNADPLRSRRIWEFLIEQKTSTCFHFEIHPSILTEEDFNVLEKAPKNLFQFEIGIQTTNKITLKAINRSNPNNEYLENIKKLIKMDLFRIHVDLIAGLPYEDYQSFKESFNDIYRLNAHHLQLGFLKILTGTEISDKVEEFEIKHLDTAPYQILSNKWISFKELSRLHLVEDVVDHIYNDHKFQNSLKFLVGIHANPFEFYEEFSSFIVKYPKDDIKNWYKTGLYLLEYAKQYFPGSSLELLDLLRLDWCKIAPSHIYPDFLYHSIDEELKRIKKALFSKKDSLLKDMGVSKKILKRAIVYKSLKKSAKSDSVLIFSKLLSEGWVKIDFDKLNNMYKEEDNQ